MIANLDFNFDTAIKIFPNPSSNSISVSIPENIGNLTSLTTLNIGNNLLDKIPSSIENLKILEILY